MMTDILNLIFWKKSISSFHIDSPTLILYKFKKNIHNKNGDFMESETNNYYNQRIQCQVWECAYFDESQERCTLGSITVGNNNQNTETYCKNFIKNESE